MSKSSCQIKFGRAFIVLLKLLFCCNAYIVDNNPYRHREVLDPEGKYVLEWLVDWETQRITFNVTVQTKGYVGLGLSRKGKMSGADIVTGGVYSDGKPYLTDRYAIGNQLPEVDHSQDWTLHSAWETKTHTFLSFSRALETCDKDHDLPIHDDVISLLWAYGEKDNQIEYHYQNRGSFDVYLLDPDLAPLQLADRHRKRTSTSSGDLKVWTISQVTPLPAKDTTYLCTIHKTPRHSSKQHIVGFNSILESDDERKHIHHFLFHRCTPPAGQDAAAIFERFVGGRGEECYVLNLPAGRIPTQYCREVVHVWAVGGKGVFFPDHVGLPMAESRNEYFLLQMHFTNSERLSGIQLKYSLEIFYTGTVRKHDGGIMAVGALNPPSPSIMVPPHSLSHLIYGHCGSGCTEKILPREGINVFAVNLHTHVAGRGIRLIHIRDNEELPWISYDDNYNFNFQQNRILRNERKILPGDTLITRCVYESTDRNGSVTTGGFRTRTEMCNGFMWYYNRIPAYLGICRSEIRSDIYKSFLQIWNTTWSDNEIDNVVTLPSHNAGLTVTEVGNRIDWTIEKRNQIQKYHRYLPQVSICPRTAEVEPSPQSQRLLQRYSLTTRRTVSLIAKKPAFSADDEIVDPENEFVSVYPEDIIPYELPDVCRRSKL